MDLSNQKLSVIPDSVFLLSNLKHLQLGNSFTIYPPLSALGSDKPSVNRLNKITNIPRDIKNLQQLRFLGLRYNQLQSLPKEIVTLKVLDTLDISFNEQLKIATEFRTLKEMTWLKYLNIAGTKSDTATIAKLRSALPNTRIEASLNDLHIQTIDNST